MKDKAILALILLVAVTLCVTIALAENVDFGAFVSGNGWDVLNGNFAGSFTNEGIYSVPQDTASDAAYTLPVTSDGNFDLTIPFILNNDQSVLYVGLSTASSAQDTSGWTVVGNGPDHNAFAYSHGGLSNIDYLGDTSANTGQQYTAHFKSTNGGTQATVGIDGYGSTTVALSGVPKFAIIYINNNGTLGTSGSVPMVTSPTYTYTKVTVSPSTSPNNSTVSPTVTAPTTNPQNQAMLNLQGIRDFYANQPVVHMSNQSVIYNPDGTVAKVINGNQVAAANATAVPTVAANATAIPTVAANATVVPVTVTPAASIPAPTKTQSPGFEMVLAAIGMLSALALITRKKK